MVLEEIRGMNVQGLQRKILIRESKRTVGCILGSFLYAFGINAFVVPAGLYSGGVLGICQVIRTLLEEYAGLSFVSIDFAGILYYAFNIPLFFIAYRKLGRKFFIKTLISVTIMTVFFAMLKLTPMIDDTLAACIIGGILAGAGGGIILRMGASGGGMDIVGVILTKWKQDFSVGKITLFVNLILYTTCLFLFDVETVLYSMIYAAVYSLAADKLHIQNINVEVNIITKVDSTAMEKEIFEEIGRGMTKWNAMGAYTHEDSHVLYVLLSKYEINQLKAIVHKYDPKAFLVVNEGVRVDGYYLKKL